MSAETKVARVEETSMNYYEDSVMIKEYSPERTGKRRKLNPKLIEYRKSLEEFINITSNQIASLQYFLQGASCLEKSQSDERTLQATIDASHEPPRFDCDTIKTCEILMRMRSQPTLPLEFDIRKNLTTVSSLPFHTEQGENGKSKFQSSYIKPELQGVKKGRLPSPAIQVLREWLRDNKDDPYPSEDTKMKFCEKTGLNMTQVNNWFSNARRRSLNLTDTSDKRYRKRSYHAMLQEVVLKTE